MYHCTNQHAAKFEVLPIQKYKKRMVHKLRLRAHSLEAFDRKARKKARIDMLVVGMRMVEVMNSIRKCLKKGEMDLEGARLLLEEFKDLPLTGILLRKHPDIIVTINKCAKLSCSPIICSIAQDLRKRFKLLFSETNVELSTSDTWKPASETVADEPFDTQVRGVADIRMSTAETVADEPFDNQAGGGAGICPSASEVIVESFNTQVESVASIRTSPSDFTANKSLDTKVGGIADIRTFASDTVAVKSFNTQVRGVADIQMSASETVADEPFDTKVVGGAGIRPPASDVIAVSFDTHVGVVADIRTSTSETVADEPFDNQAGGGGGIYPSASEVIVESFNTQVRGVADIQISTAETVADEPFDNQAGGGGGICPSASEVIVEPFNTQVRGVADIQISTAETIADEPFDNQADGGGGICPSASEVIVESFNTQVRGVADIQISTAETVADEPFDNQAGGGGGIYPSASEVIVESYNTQVRGVADIQISTAETVADEPFDNQAGGGGGICPSASEVIVESYNTQVRGVADIQISTAETVADETFDNQAGGGGGICPSASEVIVESFNTQVRGVADIQISTAETVADETFDNQAGGGGGICPSASEVIVESFNTQVRGVADIRMSTAETVADEPFDNQAGGGASIQPSTSEVIAESFDTKGGSVAGIRMSVSETVAEESVDTQVIDGVGILPSTSEGIANDTHVGNANKLTCRKYVPQGKVRKEFDVETDVGDINPYEQETDEDDINPYEQETDEDDVSTYKPSDIEPVSETDDDADESDIESDETIPFIKKMTIQKKHVLGKTTAKRHSCLFCGKLYSKLHRHLEQMHSEETDVAKVLILPKKSKERKAGWTTLMNRGDFSHNTEVLEKSHGEIIPKYRPRQGKKSVHNLIPCEFCLALFSKQTLWKHQTSCKSRTEKKRESGVISGKLLLPLPKGVNPDFNKDILVHMKDDAVKAIVVKDLLIQEFGLRLYDKHGGKGQFQNYISQKLRELGRLVMTISEVDTNIRSLEKCVDPVNWEALLTAVKTVAGFEAQQDRVYKTPSLALKLGHSLIKCTKILKTQSIKEDDDEKKRKALGFMELYEDEWVDRISSQALVSRNVVKFNKPRLLPLVEDVKKVHQHLKAKCVELQAKVKQDGNYYGEFAQSVLAQIILFNRRRSGEAARVKLHEYQTALKNKKLGKPDEEIMKSLTKFEAELCNTHLRVETFGKNKRKVAVILNKQMIRHLNVLISKREQVDVTNEFLFGRPRNSVHPYRGCDALSACVAECHDLQKPELITARNLRTQLGTLAQVLNLSETSQDIIANFLGHNITVHREFYRLPESTLELAKVTKLLNAINTGQLSKYAGQDFNQMNPEEEELELEEKSDSEDEDSDASQVSEEESEPGAAVFSSRQRSQKKKGHTSRQRNWNKWRPDEKKIVLEQCSAYIKRLKIPGLSQLERLQEKYPVLKHRTANQIKHFIRNYIKGLPGSLTAHLNG